MAILYDGQFRYAGYHGCPSVCHIRIYDPGPERPYVVVATELEDNPGTSITNVAEKVAEAVWKFLERPAERYMTWIEHYRDRALIGGHPQFKEQFDLVQFEQADRIGSTFRHPKWRRISKEEAESLCGDGVLP